MPYGIFSSFLDIVLVLTFSLSIFFASKTPLYKLTAEGLKFLSNKQPDALFKFILL